MKIPTLVDAVRIGSKPLPAVPGCYVLFVRSQSVPDLGIDTSFENNVLYVGKAEAGIERRVHKSHLLSGKSGSSTLRRSLGALLRTRLELVTQPRSESPNDTRRYHNYKFDDAGERRLTAWIADNVLVAAVPSQSLVATENILIGALEPPLYLNKWNNPWKKQISDLRKQCRILAVEWENMK